MLFWNEISSLFLHTERITEGSSGGVQRSGPCQNSREVMALIAPNLQLLGSTGNQHTGETLWVSDNWLSRNHLILLKYCSCDTNYPKDNIKERRKKYFQKQQKCKTYLVGLQIRVNLHEACWGNMAVANCCETILNIYYLGCSSCKGIKHYVDNVIYTRRNRAYL